MIECFALRKGMDAVLLRRFRLHVQNENWFAVFLDLTVVVVGLFIGLQIDAWWEGQKELQYEAAYLLEIQEDFELSDADLKDMASDLEEILQNIIVLLEQSALATPELTVAELNEHFSHVIRMPTFIPVNRAYSNLIGSGDLKLIRSRALKNALAEYYAAAKVIVLVQNTHEMELVQIYEPYIIDNLDYPAVKRKRIEDFPLPPALDEAIILDVLGNRRFRNILAQKWIILSDLLNLQREMSERTESVLVMLESSDHD